MLRFQDQNSSQTLAEGIAEFHAANPHLSTRDFSSDLAAQFFPAHDAMHVLFGKNTDLHGEAIVKYWTIGGTDLGFRGLFQYRNVQEVIDIRRGIPMRRYLRLALPMIPTMLPGILKGIRIAQTSLNKKWAHFGWRDYMDMPLKDIRKEFGIDVHALDGAVPDIPQELKDILESPPLPT